MKVLVAKSQSEGLHMHLGGMVEGLLKWQDDTKNHFKAKVCFWAMTCEDNVLLICFPLLIVLNLLILCCILLANFDWPPVNLLMSSHFFLSL